MYSIKLFIDDIRNPPDPSWTVVRNLTCALTYIEGIRKCDDIEFEAISFDHDLGGDETTRPIMLYLCEHSYFPKKIYIHTANPVGREFLEGMTLRYAPPGSLVK